MRIYVDPSFLIALYVPEPKTTAARSFIERLASLLFINQLQEIEFKNGLRQKVLRREIEQTILAKCLRLFEDDFVVGKLKACFGDMAYCLCESGENLQPPFRSPGLSLIRFAACGDRVCE